MSQITVGTAAVQVPTSQGAHLVIQNLGPGVIYLDNVSTVTTSNGFQVPVNGIFSTYDTLNSGLGAAFLISSLANTDVRYLAP